MPCVENELQILAALGELSTTVNATLNPTSATAARWCQGFTPELERLLSSQQRHHNALEHKRTRSNQVSRN